MYKRDSERISANADLHDKDAVSCTDEFIAKPFSLKERTRVVESFILK